MAKSNKQSEKMQHNRSAHIGRRLKSLRTAKKLTLEQLSRMAGVSKAMLSQIEQDKVNPTVAVMLKISGALQMAIGDLVETPVSQNVFRVISASDDKYTFRSDDGCSIRTLSPMSLEKNIEFYRITLESGGRIDSEPHYPGTEEFLYVAGGRVTVSSGEETVRLGRGDACHYRSDRPHSIANAGKSRVEAYMIVRYKGE